MCQRIEYYFIVYEMMLSILHLERDVGVSQQRSTSSPPQVKARQNEQLECERQIETRMIVKVVLLEKEIEKKEWRIVVFLCCAVFCSVLSCIVLCCLDLCVMLCYVLPCAMFSCLKTKHQKTT
jgi:hypothetical protein